MEKTEYKVGNQTLAYGYETNGTPDKRNSKVSLPFDVEQKFAYDGLGRTKEISLSENLIKDIYYAKYGDHATNRVSSVWHGVNGIRKDNTRYTYDKAGNIETVTENGKLVARYQYDGLNRLVREDNVHFGTFTYQYDAAGNILSKKSYGFTTAETLGKVTSVNEYSYKQSGWKDQLLSFNGEICNYDVLGNPTTYRDRTLTWQGRRLLSYSKDNKSADFTYNVNGIRTGKVIKNGEEIVSQTEYVYDGNNLIAEKRNNEWIYYLYGVDGVAGFCYNGETYLYRKNVQGDVTHIYKKLNDGKLELVAQYVYDAWGNYKVLNAEGVEVQSTEKVIANMNPFRYRSYYFDVETQLYYLQTRYYDAAIGRFISADSIEYLDPETLGGLNLYAYCGNNPIMCVDENGTARKWWEKLLIGLAIVAGAVLFAAAVIASAGAVAAVAGTAAAAIGLSAAAVSTVATVASIATVAVGVGIAAFGVSDAIEVWSDGVNPIRDWVMGGNQTLYDNTKLGFNIAGSVATLIGAVAPKFIQQISKTGKIILDKSGNVVGSQLNFYDYNGNWNFRIDSTTHGNSKLHHNPHIHTLFRDAKQGGFSDAVYYFWEVIINWLKKRR